MKIPKCQTCRVFLVTFIVLVITLSALAQLSHSLPVLYGVCIALSVFCALCVLLLLTRNHL